jgi:hypothetical protein
MSSVALCVGLALFKGISPVIFSLLNEKRRWLIFHVFCLMVHTEISGMERNRRIDLQRWKAEFIVL